jgi:hypothetical protein
MAVNSDVTDQVAALLLASNEEAEYVPVELPAFATSKGDVIGKVDRLSLVRLSLASQITIQTRDLFLKHPEM